MRNKSKILLIIMLIVSFNVSSAFANQTSKKIFVSFSMPDSLLSQVTHEASSLEIPLILNGMHNHSMRETLGKIFSLVQKEKNVSIQIDPIAFEKYGIKRVPALVVDDGIKVDVIRGNIRIKEMLELVQKHDDTHA